MKLLSIITLLFFTTILNATSPKLSAEPKKKKAQTSLGLYVESKDAAIFLDKNESFRNTIKLFQMKF